IDTHGSNEGNDQPSRTPDLHVIGTVIPVLPQDSIILLMHAYSVFQCTHTAIIFRHVRIEILNEAKAIAAPLQTVSQPAHSIFPHVECILETVIRARIPIWYHHFGEPDRAEQRATIVIQIM